MGAQGAGVAAHAVGDLLVGVALGVAQQLEELALALAEAQGRWGRWRRLWGRGSAKAQVVQGLFQRAELVVHVVPGLVAQRVRGLLHGGTWLMAEFMGMCTGAPPRYKAEGGEVRFIGWGDLHSRSWK